jgi:ribosome recycling factor
MGSKEEIAQARNRMEKAIEDLKKELATIRTGRASISILDSIQVDYYGTPTPINQVAQMGTPDATLNHGSAL